MMIEPDFALIETIIREVTSKVTFRVREYTRDIKGSPGHSDFKNYYVYCSDGFKDYYKAIHYAIQYEKRTGIKTWVDCINTYEYFDNEVLTNEGFVKV